jgi:hypothetical protein
MNDEVNSVWTVVVVAYFKTARQHLPGTEENLVNSSQKIRSPSCEPFHMKQMCCLRVTLFVRASKHKCLVISSWQSSTKPVPNSDFSSFGAKSLSTLCSSICCNFSPLSPAVGALARPAGTLTPKLAAVLSLTGLGSSLP